MNLYIYAKSSHRESFENVRRCAALANSLEFCKPTLCTGDYRAASIAKDTLDVKRTMGIDAMGNLPHTMERLDILIYDNQEVDVAMHAQMDAFCSKLYAFGKELPYDIVDANYFEVTQKSVPHAIFFGDDDYHKWFVDFCKDSKKYDLPLLNGNYFFLETAKEYAKSFSEVVDEEEYSDFVKQSEFLLTASVHTCLEVMACGGKPVFFLRQDREVANLELLQKYNIPTAQGANLDALMEDFYRITQEYPELNAMKPYDASWLEEEIQTTFKANEHILPAMDYEYYYAK